jgi:hypothetical protein
LKKKAHQLFDKDYDWHIRFYNELRQPGYFNSVMQDIVGPVADAEGNLVYAQNAIRDNLISILGKNKKSRKSNISLENEVIAMMKK